MLTSKDEKPLHPAVLALIALLLLFGLSFLGRFWFPSPRNPDAPQTQTTRGISSAEAGNPASLPPSDRAAADTGSNRQERLSLEVRELEQTSAALEGARRKAEADKRRAEASAEAMSMLTSKLLDGSLKVPRTPSEAGLLTGQSLADAARFRQKWGDSIPEAGTAEADEYAKEQEALVSESAAFMKFMADKKNAALLAQPDGIAQFQTTSLIGALDLRDDQVQGISTTLNGYYQQYFALGLNTAAQPQTGIEGWQQQRGTLSRQSWAAVSALLTPEQTATFQRLYPPSGGWLLIMSTPEVPGLDETD